ncbi:invasion associated locus B family protein [Rhizobium puerariae]|uniref:Invasion associated locus B family protein n=1 Tax=Rhizobium puerariae TaxID=1585791 RepID=A0ABV6ABZ6_9HYPH
MNIKPFALGLSLIFVSAASAGSQPTRVAQFEAWGVYSYVNSGQTTCYALSVPVTSRPSAVDHGDNFFLIAPQGPSGYAPQAIMGYPIREGSEVRVTVGGDTFRLVPKDNAAWLRDQSREPVLVDAMRRGSDMTLEATSRRGTSTSYSYSLRGVSAALQEVRRCR